MEQVFQISKDSEIDLGKQVSFQIQITQVGQTTEQVLFHRLQLLRCQIGALDLFHALVRFDLKRVDQVAVQVQVVKAVAQGR